MIITQTPVRISFLGGGTDYPDYYLQHGGETLTASIDQYTTVTVHPLTQFVDYSLRIHYSDFESAKHLEEIKHGSARETLRFFDIARGLEIYYANDLPARTGLGSSSSAAVGLLLALHTMRGESVTLEKLAEEAIKVEREMVKDRVGSQDQYICSLGGFRHLRFLPDGSVRTDPVPINTERIKEIEDKLLLLYTGRQRTAHDILEEQIGRTQSGDNNRDLASMKKLVARGVALLASSADLAEFGSLLHEGWVLKRRLSSQISPPWIDELYETARKAGAEGGKLLGAGGGGVILLYVEPKKRGRVREALSELPEAKFSFENKGAHVIFHQPRRLS